MPFWPILYYGTPGLESDIFLTYIRSAGYPAELITAPTPDLPDIAGTHNAIIVLAYNKTLEELLEYAAYLRARGSASIRKVFVLSDAYRWVPTDPVVEVIKRPYHLSQVVKRIQEITINK